MTSIVLVSAIGISVIILLLIVVKDETIKPLIGLVIMASSMALGSYVATTETINEIGSGEKEVVPVYTIVGSDTTEVSYKLVDVE